MEYFILYPHCYYVGGLRKSSIYDILRKRNIWIGTEWQVKTLEKSREGLSLEEIAKMLGHPREEVRKFAEWLEVMDLGYVGAGYQASVKYKPLFSTFMQYKDGISLPLGRVMLEVASTCTMGCSFCNSQERLASMECTCGCYSDTGRIQYPIEETLSRLVAMNPFVLDIMGGDPLANREDVYQILDCAKKYHINAVLRTSGASIDREIIRALKAADAGLVLNLINFAPQTGSGRPDLLLNMLKLSKEENYERFSFALLYDRAHWKDFKDARGWLSEYGEVTQSVLLYDKADDFSRQDMKAKMAARDPSCYALGLQEFIRMEQGSPCFQDSICIMSDGTVRRCIADAENAYGNVKEENILDILRRMRCETLEQAAAQIAGGKVSVCQNCEFRTGCFGCEITTQKYGDCAGKNSWTCSYDPHRGEFCME